MRPLGGDDDPLAGREIDGRYRLLSLLGVGGMGFVYLAEQVGLGRRVAVKMLFAERARDEAAVRRFAREARTLASVDHPGIVRVLDYGSGEHPYIAMELVQGPSLQRIVDGTGALPPGLAVRLVARIAEGLAAAHERGIVHRDLKPGNVHVIARDDDVEVRILDFGLALLDPGRNDVSTRLTRAGLVAGTPEYMAPEQIRGEPTDGRTDLIRNATDHGLVVWFAGPCARTSALAPRAETIVELCEGTYDLAAELAAPDFVPFVGNGDVVENGFAYEIVFYVLRAPEETRRARRRR
jgi:serine/threonine protein kinase